MTKELINTLKHIYTKLDDQNINWVLTGSLSFALRGMKTEINDIDIQTDKEGAYKIEKLFQNNIVKRVQFSSTDSIRSHFGSFTLNGVKVEIMGDIEKKVNNRWHKPVDLSKCKEYVHYENMDVPVLSLQHEHEAYLALGRIRKATKILDLIKGG